MTWILVAFDDYTLGAVIDDARVRSLEESREFLVLTPENPDFGDENASEDGYLSTLDDCLARLRDEGVEIRHQWIPGEDIEQEIVDVGHENSAEGVVIAHHNPDAAFPDPGAFDDALRRQLDVAVDVISLE